MVSPCISMCGLDTNKVCMGCYRHIDEILAWRDYSDVEKAAVITKTIERKNACVDISNGTSKDTT